MRTPGAASLNRIFNGLGMELSAVESETVDLIAQIEVAGKSVRLAKAPGSEGWTI